MESILASLLRRYQADRSAVVTSNSWPEVAAWMCERVQPSVSASTWAVYRSALLKGVVDDGMKVRVKGVFKANKLISRRPKRVIKRRKGMSPGEESALMAELLGPRRKTYGRIAAIWWKAAVATGARPSEWLESAITIVDGVECLRIKNAKRIDYDDKTLLETIERQGRVSAVYRTIPLGHLPEKTVEFVRAQVAFMNGVVAKGMYLDVYESVRKTIRQAGEYLWHGEKKYPSLYTARHVYRDRMRAMLAGDGLNKGQLDVVVAVLMGHGSTKSQYAYGIDDDSIDVASSSVSIESLSPQIKVLLKQALTVYD